MNKKKIIILMLGIFFAFPSVALAHPGRLDSMVDIIVTKIVKNGD